MMQIVMNVFSININRLMMALAAAVVIFAGCESVDCPEGKDEVEKPSDEELENILQRERDVLIMLCGTLGGEYWWSGDYDRKGYVDKPVGEWDNVITDEDGRVISLHVTPYFEARLTSQIGVLERLQSLSIPGNGSGCISGPLPKELADCKDLMVLNLPNNKIESIPGEISQCKNLRYLDLRRNNLYGIPLDLGNINLEYLNLSNNGIKGLLPPSIMENKRLWSYSWGDILDGNNFYPSDMAIPGPEFRLEDIDGNLMDSGEEYKNNVLTVFLHWKKCSRSKAVIVTLKELYARYGESGLNIIGISDIYDLKEQVESLEIPWRNIRGTADLRGEPLRLPDFNNPEGEYRYWKAYGYPSEAYPSVVMVNSEGQVIFHKAIAEPEEYEWFIKSCFEDVPDMPVLPDDPSFGDDVGVTDGTVKTLQTAKEGKGIDIVLMGDAYTRESVYRGGYRESMIAAMEAFFAIEPFKTFRSYFNVHAVFAHSESDGYVDGKSTVFDTWIEGTSAGGNDETVLSYARKAIPEEKLEKSVIMVLINEDSYAGTSYLYRSVDGNCGNGTAIAYIPAISDPVRFAGLVQHEAGGHCFGKLADEYASDDGGAVPQEVMDKVKELAKYGWYRNVDFTSEPSAVKWWKFLADERYSADGLGVYQSAMGYWEGIWKPSVNSIMRYNEGAFNAPSRDAIYRRIMTLAKYSSNYSYEEFVEYDEINRAVDWTKAPSAAPSGMVPLPPPVVR